MNQPTFTTDPPLSAMDHTGGGKPSQYHPTIGAVICALIEAGLTVREVAAHPDMPSYATIFQWRRVNPDFDEMYRAMRSRIAAKRVEAACGELEAKRAARIELAKAQGRRPRDWVSGKKSTYDRAWAQAYCDEIAQGASVYELVCEPGMPSPRAVYRWLRRFPEFRDMYAQARSDQQNGLEMIRDGVAMSDIETQEDFTQAKREVAQIEGRMGRVGAKVWG